MIRGSKKTQVKLFKDEPCRYRQEVTFLNLFLALFFPITARIGFFEVCFALIFADNGIHIEYSLLQYFSSSNYETNNLPNMTMLKWMNNVTRSRYLSGGVFTK